MTRAAEKKPEGMKHEDLRHLVVWWVVLILLCQHEEIHSCWVCVGRLLIYNVVFVGNCPGFPVSGKRLAKKWSITAEACHAVSHPFSVGGGSAAPDCAVSESTPSHAEDSHCLTQPSRSDDLKATSCHTMLETGGSILNGHREDWHSDARCWTGEHFSPSPWSAWAVTNTN